MLNVIPLLDIVTCEIMLGFHKVLIVNIYAPPDMSLDDFDSALDALSLYLLDKRLIVFGDFNCPNFNSSGRDNDRKYLSLLNFMSILNLHQCNFVTNSNDRLLDLIFTNLDCNITVSRDSDPLIVEDSYHPALLITLDLNVTTRVRTFPSNNNIRFNFRKANYITLYNDISVIDWSFLSQFTDVNEALSAFYDKLNSVIRRSVPTIGNKKSGRYFPPWFNSKIIKLIKLKEHYFKKWKKFNNPVFYNEFKRLRSLVKTETRSAFISYQNNMEAGIASNPKLFWQFINNKRGTSRVPGTMMWNNTSLEKPDDIVAAFRSTFASVYDISNSTPPVDVDLEVINNSFNFVQFTAEEVLDSFKKLKSNMTAGHDGLPGFFVRDCASVLCEPLTVIFNLSLTTDIFPNYWKISRITPIFKKDDPADVANYRPISILSNFAKIFEQLLYVRLFNGVKSYLSIHQHGFITGRSTVTNLSVLSQFISESLDNRQQVDVIYTDFTKAFDTIDHNLLVSKLLAIGCSPKLANFLKSYLLNRSCYVHYNGFVSTSFIAASGVPQGSNLGPLLFNVYINDLLNKLNCDVLAYADDIKIFCRINSPSDCQHLQNNLSVINTWCMENRVNLNINKCGVVTFARVSNPHSFIYNIDQIPIPRKSEIKDLGILFDTKLSFTNHIASISKSASKMLGFIIRSCRQFTSPLALISLFYSLVRSKLEYASVIWYPCYLYQQLMLERVQRRFLKYLSFKFDGTYPPRGVDYEYLLCRHNFSSLSQRRDEASGKFLMNLILSRSDNPCLLSQVYFLVPIYGTRSSDTVLVPRARTNSLYGSPLGHMTRNFNLLFPDPF